MYEHLVYSYAKKTKNQGTYYYRRTLTVNDVAALSLQDEKSVFPDCDDLLNTSPLYDITINSEKKV